MVDRVMVVKRQAEGEENLSHHKKSITSLGFKFLICKMKSLSLTVSKIPAQMAKDPWRNIRGELKHTIGLYHVFISDFFWWGFFPFLRCMNQRLIDIESQLFAFFSHWFQNMRGFLGRTIFWTSPLPPEGPGFPTVMWFTVRKQNPACEPSRAC